MNIIILGAPGSGKGTQAKRLARKFDLLYFSSGDLSRTLAKTNSRISEIINSGKLIPENEMTRHTRKYLDENMKEKKGIIFDGYPRFILQYKTLEKWLKARGQKIDLTVFLELDEEEATKRISSRRVCTACGRVYNLVTNPPPTEEKCECGGELILRKDDAPESVKIRFREYQKNTKEVIDYIDNKKGLTKIDGARPINVIQDDLVGLIRKQKNA